MLLRTVVPSSFFITSSLFRKQQRYRNNVIISKRTFYEWGSKDSSAPWGKMSASEFKNEESLTRRAKPAELILEFCNKIETEPSSRNQKHKILHLSEQITSATEGKNDEKEKLNKLDGVAEKEQKFTFSKDVYVESVSGFCTPKKRSNNHNEESTFSERKTKTSSGSSSLVSNTNDESHDIVVDKVNRGIDLLTKRGFVSNEPAINFVPAPAVLSDGKGYFADQPNEISEIFYNSVQEHTVGNRNLRKYINSVPIDDLPMMYAAISGADAGGLQLDALTYETIVSKLCAADKFQAAIQTYHEMIKHKVLPTSQTYGKLMEISLKREIPSLCHSLFRDMLRYGAKPNALNYQQLILSMAHEFPSRWEEAIAIFDKISRQRSPPLNAQTYNALMMVYMNMRPFDWRIVYNCYYEMRIRENPRIRLEWESYLILEEAMRRGRAGWLRRFFALVDA